MCGGSSASAILQRYTSSSLSAASGGEAGVTNGWVGLLILTDVDSVWIIDPSGTRNRSPGSLIRSARTARNRLHLWTPARRHTRQANRTVDLGVDRHTICLHTANLADKGCRIDQGCTALNDRSMQCSTLTTIRSGHRPSSQQAAGQLGGMHDERQPVSTSCRLNG
jgi:hypothetical protein